MSFIRREILSGVFWIAVAKYTGLFISLGITAVLARNVSPEAFGTMAVATVIMTFLDIFADMGIGPAIIQFKDLTTMQINSLFMVGACLGVVLATGLFVIAPLLADFYDDSDLINICRLLSVCMLFNALNIVPNGLMLKAKRFRTVAMRTLFFQVLCGIAAIWGALNGLGIYALIITPVLSSIGVFAVNYYNYPQKLIFNIDFGAVKRVCAYSSFQFLFSFINYFSRNIDKLIIGKYFSMTDLGYYDKSYRLMQLPLQNITFVISPVLHPVLSSLQNDKCQLSDKNISITVLLSYISFPLGILLYFCAGDIVEIIFGPQWKNAVPVFKILALSLPLQLILSTSGSLFQAAGKTNHMCLSGLINTIVTVIGFMVAALYFKTIESMAWAWDITLTLNFITTYILMNRLTFGCASHVFFSVLIPQLVNTLIVFLVAWVVLGSFVIDNVVVSLIVKSVVIIIPTVVIAYVMGQYDIFSIIRKLYRKI